MIPNGDLGNWSSKEIDRLEMAQQGLRMVIASYSARIAKAAGDEAGRLRAERSQYAAQLHRLDPTDEAELTRVIDEAKAKLQQDRKHQ